jgi:hypothetical protein
MNEPLTSSGVLGMLTGSPEGRPARFRVSRPCYDKMHRCPGWAGGGTRYAKVRRCDNGYINYYTTTRDSNQVKRLWKWRLNRCPKCRVIVLPYLVRWLDYGWWRWKISRKWRDLKYRWSNR